MRKHGYGGWMSAFICSLFIFTIFTTQAAFAGVTLSFEDYVYLGAFEHRKHNSNNDYEPDPMPVLWRVRSADASRAVLLTHYLVDRQRWSSASLPAPLSPDYQGAWATSSDLRVSLNDTTDGFLEHFSASERSLMSTSFASSDPAYVAEDKVTLPSLSEISAGGLMGFGDFVDNYDARSADFKTPNTPTFGYHYWLRSSGSINNPSAAYVISYGLPYPDGGDVGNLGGVRPASQISLNLITQTSQPKCGSRTMKNQ